MQMSTLRRFVVAVIALCAVAAPAEAARKKKPAVQAPVAAPVPPAPVVSVGPIACADTETYFTATLPAGWVPGAAPTKGGVRRCSAASPDGLRDVGIYAFVADGDVDLPLLADNGPKMFTDLGPETARDRDWEWLQTVAIDVVYGPNASGDRTLAHYTAESSVAYIVIAYSKDGDFAQARAVIDSLKADVPARVRVAAQMGAAMGFGLLLLALPFGGAGYAIKHARLHLGALDDVRSRILREGHGLSPKWYAMRRRHRAQLGAAVAGVFLAYFASFAVLPGTVARWSLLYLVPVALGYLGIFIVPGDD